MLRHRLRRGVVQLAPRRSERGPLEFFSTLLGIGTLAALLWVGGGALWRFLLALHGAH